MISLALEDDITRITGAIFREMVSYDDMAIIRWTGCRDSSWFFLFDLFTGVGHVVIVGVGLLCVQGHIALCRVGCRGG